MGQWLSRVMCTLHRTMKSTDARNVQTIRVVGTIIICLAISIIDREYHNHLNLDTSMDARNPTSLVLPPIRHESCVPDHLRELLLRREPANGLNEVLVRVSVASEYRTEEGNH